MNLMMFIKITTLLFISFLMLSAYSFATVPQDTIKKVSEPLKTTPGNAQKPSSPGDPANLKQPMIIRPGENQVQGKDPDPMKQFSKKELSVSPSQPKKTTDPDELKAEELFKTGSRKGSQGDYNGAIEDLTQSLALHKDANTYMKRSLAYIMMDNYPSAIEDLNDAIKLLPDNVKAYFTRGVCYYEINDFVKADEDLSKSIELDPKNALAYNYKAAIKYREQDFQGALANYSEVIRIDSSNKQAYTNRGMIRHYLKDFRGAIEDYDKALKLDPYNATAYNNRGAAKLTLKDYNGALMDFDAALQLKDDYADAYGNRGAARINLGNKIGACDDWQKAFSLGMKGVTELIAKHCQ